MPSIVLAVSGFWLAAVLATCFPWVVVGLQQQYTFALDFEQAYASEGLASQIYGNHPKARVHRSSSKHRGGKHHVASASSVKIMYHHIWKCGGTHFCTVAEADGFQVPKNTGCHRWRDAHAPLELLETGDGNITWRPCGILGNESDMLALAETPFNFYGHECPVNKRMLKNARGAGFKWMVILRSPLEQAVSWYRHVREWTEVEPSLSEWVVSQKARTGFAAFVDNLQTRWLAGQECLPAACPDILGSTERCSGCMDLAKKNLQSMDAVLEQRGRQVRGMEKLHAIGWPASVLDGLPFEEDETSAYVQNMGDIERDLLTKTQGADIALFEWAKAEGII